MKKALKVYQVNRKSQEEKEFDKQIRIARSNNFSPFAQFCIDLKGYDLFYKGGKIAKYEAWDMKHRNIDMIKQGLTAITLKIKTPTKEETEN